MALTIGDYTVEIKAKNKQDARYTKHTTESFLNELSLALDYASDYEFEVRENNAIARHYRTMSNDIYYILREHGVYDDWPLILYAATRPGRFN